MGNFNQAAYDLAQTMYNNLTSVKTDLASVAKQAHQTAKAIAGVASGTVAGSADVTRWVWWWYWPVVALSST